MDLAHIAISTVDLNNSVKWYGDFFGFKEIKRFEKQEFEIKGATISDGQIMIEVLMQWMAFIWFMLVMLHFFPGFPLDGGRALRVFLWRLTHNYARATRIASWLGWGFGLIMTASGIALLVLTVELFAGLLLVVFGLLLQNAATNSGRWVGQVETVETDMLND